ncbi:MAG: SRPBCC domain-containing protein [Lewinellaceae bacterium]|nr:SRPBCC domain-containing protein [Saprospiraceae bacterium]MCB9329506.1 SRPBCC domain-containing protein [Lewinellaceae bacterium]
MRQVQTTIQIQVPPPQVIQALLDQNMLKAWWGVERSLIVPQPGGVYVLTWQISDAGFGYVTSGTIHTLQKDRKLCLENLVYLNPQRPILGPMRLCFDAQKQANQTMLTIVQDGYREGHHWDWYYQAVLKAWPVAAQHLKAYLEQ